jgi:ubiquinone/menaquinone biosynthesis C-methylase UbiE
MTTDYFASVATQWDDLRASMFTEAVRSAALERAGLHLQSIAADLGAGTGFISQGLAPLVEKVHLVDNSPEMLAVARQNLAQFSNVEYHLADGARIPLPDNSVDAVLANMYLHHAPDPFAAIQEMVRILRPGGRVVITDSDEHSYTWLREEHSDLWMGFPRPQVKAWFEKAGLVNVRVEDTSENCTCPSPETQEQVAITIFAAVGTLPQPGMRQAVQDHYRQVAVNGSSCCGSKETLSSQDAIPLEVIQPAVESCCSPDPAQAEADLSLGCGSPVELAGLQPGEVVLDIGSGAGADVFPAARIVGPQGRAIGLDMLEEMLSRARATAEKHGYQNVEFHQGDAEHIPLPDSTVDVVMSNCVINLVPDKAQAFREIQRVLRPGGRLAVSDVVTDRPFSPAYRSDPDSWAACVSGALPESEYLALISQAGFTDINTTSSQAWPAEDGTLVYSLKVTACKHISDT